MLFRAEPESYEPRNWRQDQESPGRDGSRRTARPPSSGAGQAPGRLSLAFRLRLSPARCARICVRHREATSFSARRSMPPLALLRQRLPTRWKTSSSRPRRICRHRFDLLGYDRSRLWQADRLAPRRGTRQACSAQGLLQGSISGFRQKWATARLRGNSTGISILSRWPKRTGSRANIVLPTRFCASGGTGKPRIRIRSGINWASSLEVAFRSLSWIWTYHLLQEARRVARFARGVAPRPGAAWTTYRALSFHLFLSQHAFARGRRWLCFFWECSVRSLPRRSDGRSGLGDRLDGSCAAGPARRISL